MGNISLFSFKGILFKAHWSLFLLCAYWIFRDNDPLRFRYNIAMSVLLFLTVCVHELGHAFTARAVGGKAHEIVLWPLGGLAYTSGHGTLHNQLKVTLGGPLTHIPLALLFLLPAVLIEKNFSWAMITPFFDQLPATNLWSAFAIIGTKMQVIFFLFNLFVPAYPLDCGHVIVESMLIRGKSPEWTAKLIIGLSAFTATVLCFAFHHYLIAAYILYSTWQLNEIRTKGQLASHPLFHTAMNLPIGRWRQSSSHLKLVKKKSPDKKTCPSCLRELPPQAIMCGFCEKELPT